MKPDFSTWTNYVTVKPLFLWIYAAPDFSTWTNYVTVKHMWTDDFITNDFSTWTNYVTVKQIRHQEYKHHILVPEQITWL